MFYVFNDPQNSTMGRRPAKIQWEEDLRKSKNFYRTPREKGKFRVSTALTSFCNFEKNVMLCALFFECYTPGNVGPVILMTTSQMTILIRIAMLN